MATVNTFALLPALKARLSYDPDKDFVALTRVASGADVIAVHPSLGVGTIADLVRLAKARPGQLNYGTSGNGTNQHLGGEMFNVLAGVQTVHVPYKGVAAPNAALRGWA
jgi:tripartite-type tricarboxylate transporter receptor subunit TctC